MTKSYIKLNKQQQRDLLILDIVFSLVIIYLFNIYWAPLVFMISFAYIILNKDHALSPLELLALFGVVIPFLMHCILARYIGMGGSLIFIIPWVIVVLFAYSFVWRKTR